MAKSAAIGISEIASSSELNISRVRVIYSGGVGPATGHDNAQV
jgi:hypothetical protein